MPTRDQIDEQIQLERDAIASGLNKLRKQNDKLEGQSYASATVYGVASIDTMLPVVIEWIEKTAVKQIKEGKNGQHYKEIAHFLKDIEPMAAAAIACKVVFDRVFSADNKASHLVNVANAVGQALENECQMRHYEQNAPGLLNVLKKNYWHR